jgi:hypothetical protein
VHARIIDGAGVVFKTCVSEQPSIKEGAAIINDPRIIDIGASRINFGRYRIIDIAAGSRKNE